MIVPCGHRLVVKAYKQVEVDEVLSKAKASGFLDTFTIVKDEGAEKREDASVDKGIVVAIGSTAWQDFGGTPWCAVGDEIVFAKFAGKVVTDPETNEDVFVLNDEDVIAVITKGI